MWKMDGCGRDITGIQCIHEEIHNAPGSFHQGHHMELLMMTPHGGEMMEVDMEDEWIQGRYCGYTEHSRGDTVCTW